jgi:hypothetical protein
MPSLKMAFSGLPTMSGAIGGAAWVLDQAMSTGTLANATIFDSAAVL